MKLNYQKKQILTIVLLLLFIIIPIAGLVGLLLMWRWMNWRKGLKVLVTLIFIVIFIIASVLPITYTFFYKPVSIMGDAMNPNYRDGQFYITNVLNDKDKLRRGDVVVAYEPSDSRFDIIKRVVALPNERVLIQNGTFYVDGNILEESNYMVSKEPINLPEGSILQEGREYVVPTDSYFLLGDNRAPSRDSRSFGAIKRDAITATVGMCYWHCQK